MKIKSNEGVKFLERPVLCRWGRETWKFGFIKLVDEGTLN